MPDLHHHYDSKNGVILAAVEETGRYDHPVPEASDGNEVGTFDVPASAARSRLDEICVSHRVDVASQRLVSAKPQAS
jgi:hypothetical protein